MQYLFVKYSHRVFVTITILLLSIRLSMLWRHPERPLASIWKAMPRLNDTMSLFTGSWLMKTTHFSSFSAPRFGMKILLSLTYIVLGMIMIRLRPRSLKFYAVYVLAMSYVATTVLLAKIKTLPLQKRPPEMYPHFSIIVLSNDLVDPTGQVRVALTELDAHPEIRPEKASSPYLIEPAGYDDQPDFINAVCAARTSLDDVALLAELDRIEAELGCKRNFHNAPHTLDLDIIDFGGIHSDDPHLTLLHPRTYERSFTMLLLAGILPDFGLGEHGRVADLAQALDGQGIRLLKE